MTAHSYPGSPFTCTWREFAVTCFRGLQDANNSMVRAGVCLDGRFRALQADDIPLVIVARNERRLIGPFLDHYRALGVTRFLWLDDASDDGSPELLSAQLDVDVLTSNVRYSEAHRGRLWREMIVDRYGRDRWYVMVDADEFLIYKNSEIFKLTELTRALQSKGVKHLFAPMIDLYPRGNLEEAIYNGDRMPWTVADRFDADGYLIKTVSRGWYVEGGIRHRFSKMPPLLTKYPLVFWDRRTHLNSSIHFPGPYYRNLSPPMGALLHFKFFSDFRTSFHRIIENGNHFDGGAFYNAVLDGLEHTDRLDSQDDRSIKYKGSLQMHRLGFFTDWQ